MSRIVPIILFLAEIFTYYSSIIFSILLATYYSQNYAGIIHQGLLSIEINQAAHMLHRGISCLVMSNFAIVVYNIGHNMDTDNSGLIHNNINITCSLNNDYHHNIIIHDSITSLQSITSYRVH